MPGIALNACFQHFNQVIRFLVYVHDCLHQDGQPVAVGLTHYSAVDLLKLCGKKSTEIESVLGYTFGEEAIHRDHMVLL